MPRSKRTAWNSREAWNRERAPFDWLFPFVDKNTDGKITTDEYQALQVYKKTHADWQDRARKELGMKPAQSNHEIKQQD